MRSCAEISERNAAVGVPLDGGEAVWLDTTRFGRGHAFIPRGADRRLYLLDPVKREVLATGDLPVQITVFPTLNDAPVGPHSLMRGIGDGDVFAFTPADNRVKVLGRHPSLANAHGFLATATGVLYYGSGADLWRCPLP